MQDEKYEYRGHTWFLDKNAGKQVCAYCGLVGLRNTATDWCVSKGCYYKLHGSYKGVMKKLTKQFDF